MGATFTYSVTSAHTGLTTTTVGNAMENLYAQAGIYRKIYRDLTQVDTADYSVHIDVDDSHSSSAMIPRDDYELQHGAGSWPYGDATYAMHISPSDFDGDYYSDSVTTYQTSFERIFLHEMGHLWANRFGAADKQQTAVDIEDWGMHQGYGEPLGLRGDHDNGSTDDTPTDPLILGPSPPDHWWPSLPGWLLDPLKELWEGIKNIISPLILDLDGDGIELSSLANSETRFDLSGNDFAVHTGWTTGDDGFLVVDLNENGQIDDISELFGNAELDGFTFLEAYDTNDDGVIDASDDDFDQLLIWQDLDSDGVVDDGELQSLADWDILSISLSGVTRADTTLQGHSVTHVSTYTYDTGSGTATRDIKDIWFENDPTNSTALGPYVPDIEALFLPDLRGFGSLPDLYVAMCLDGEDEGNLKDLVAELASLEFDALFSADTDNLLVDILFRWAGVDDVELGTRGPFVNARELAFLEAFFGEDHTLNGSYSNPQGPNAGNALGDLFDDVLGNIKAQLFLQVGADAFFEAGEAAYNSLTGEIDGTLALDETFVTTTLSDMAGEAEDGEEFWAAVGEFIQYVTTPSPTERGWLDSAVDDSDVGDLEFWSDVEKLNDLPIGEEWDGTLGNDSHTGTALRDIIYGDDGDDELHGGDGNDYIEGNADEDVLYGDGGDDTLIGGSGNDTLYGGDGNDFLYATFNPGTTNDTLDGGAGSDYMQGNNGNQIYNYTSGNDGIKDTGGTDKIVILDDSIGAADISFIRLADETLQIVVGSLGSIFIEAQSGSSASRAVETLEFTKIGESSIDLLTLDDLVTIGSDASQSIRGAYSATAGNLNDTIYGYGGNDKLNGDNGNDILYGGDGQDELYGGNGTDYLYGDAGNDYIDGGLGNTTDYLYGGDGDDEMYAGNGDDEIYAGDGDDYAEGEDGADLIYGGEGDDELSGGDGADTIYGEEGNDFLRGGNGNDNLYGGDDDDILRGFSGNDLLDGGAGNDTADYSTANNAVTVSLAITSAQNTVGNGTDTLTSIENLVGSEHNDTLTGDSNDNIIEGGDGNDTLDGGSGTDTASYSSASSAVTVDLSNGSAQNTGGAGTDTLTSFENLTGSAYNDTLTGTSAANIIKGGAGDDTIIAGVGNDTFDGGTGSDTVDYSGAAGGINVNLATGAVSDDGDSGTDTLSSIENIVGTGYNDAIVGNSSNNTINGGAGTDTISFAAAISGVIVDLTGGTATGDGDDTISNFENVTGSDYDDTITGTSGNNTIDGGAGSDTVDYSAAASAMTVNLSTGSASGDGTDTLTSIENIIGSANNDAITGNSSDNTIEGGAGNDTLDGGSGTDTASYAGAGSAVTVDLSNGSAQNTVGAGTDTLTSFENLTGSDYNDTLTGTSGANVIKGGAGDDTIKGDAGDDTLDGGSGVDTVSFAGAGAVTVNLALGTATGDGTDTLTGFENVVGSAYDDTIIGDDEDNVLEGGSGNDTLVGGRGNDTLDGGAGAQNLADYSADPSGVNVNLTTGTATDGWGDTDTLTGIQYVTGSAYSDTLTGSSTNNTIDGNAGDDIIYGAGLHDELNGGDGDDTIYGDDGDDNIDGDSGDDTIYGADGVDGIYGGTGDDLIYGGDGNDILRGEDDDDVIYGDAGNDTLYGGNENDILYGGDGDDTIHGGAGSDFIYGGDGLDTLYALGTGGGTDYYNVFVFEAASAFNDVDVIMDFSDAATLYDMVDIRDLLSAYTPGVDDIADFVSIYEAGSDTFIAVDADGGGDGFVDVVKLDGVTGLPSLSTMLSEHRLLIGGETVFFGSTGTDTLTGTSGVDLIFGLTGTDTINAGAGNDLVIAEGNGQTINGEDGDDILKGGGSDDTISGGAGNDTLDGGSGSSDTVSYAAAASGVTVSLASGTASNDGDGGSDTLTGFENVTGSANADTITGSTAANVINGLAGNDTITAGTGADTIDGGDGDDTINLANGDFATGESITGGDGSDTIVLTDGTTVDFTSGTLATVETLTGSSSNDTVTMLATDAAGMFTSIDLGGGTDTLNIIAAGDITGASLATRSNIETGNLKGTSSDDTITLTGAQLDSIIVGSGKITLAGGTDTLNLTSTSADLNTLGAGGNSNITGLEVISAAGAGSGVTVTLSGQSEAFTVTGSASADTITAGSGADTLYGGDGDDTLTGGGGNDLLYAQDGLDTLYGGSGADTFVFEADSAYNDVDQIADFSTGESDKLDISDLLDLYEYGVDDLLDFVKIEDSGSDSVVKIDADGGGDSFVTVATILGVTGLTDEAALESAGTLITH